MTIITLTTDFGDKDGFVGTMKGVIWGIFPEAQIADITHAISPQNVLEGAYALWRAYSYFPAGTVHIAVIDPGVGSNRRPIAAKVGTHYFVGPDNGLFTLMYEDTQKGGWSIEIVELVNKQYWLQNISHTFHGRDIFAPVAAHLARGAPFLELGVPIQDPIQIPLPKPEKTTKGWRAQIVAIDHFGNCTTNLPAQVVTGRGEITIHLLGHTIDGIVPYYGRKNTGELIALVDSENYIEIAIVNGNASDSLGVKVGDILDVLVEP